MLQLFQQLFERKKGIKKNKKNKKNNAKEI